ncbi:MAG TPA: hydroxymethylbilane synthase [Candidatus Paceibacterota bacterium]|nr:hydroxymethylbilane synthase [Candidatus Paceibacterota bacterium]
MTRPERITIGTRGSALALKQADIVKAALTAAEPSLSIDIRVIETRGDADQRPIPLDTVGKGWFTKEIEELLLTGEIDLAVHSLKDMAEDMPEGLNIGAYLPREDARDVLVTKNGEPLEALKRGAVVGTDSARRQVQMLALRPDVKMESVRGNVPTRLEKLSSGNYDAIIIAAAGLKRLGLEARVTRYFEPNEMTPAPGQGILAVQAKKGGALDDILKKIQDADAARAARIERSFSKAMGGGCKSPTGAYAFRQGNKCVLIGMRETDDKKVIREELRAPWEDSHSLGERLARKFLEA